MKTFLIGAALLAGAAPLFAQAPPQPAPAATQAAGAATSPLTLEKAAPLFNAPTLVTLHLKDAPFQKFLDELATQVDGVVRTNLSEEEPKTVTIDIDKQPFWDAVRIMGEKLRLWIVPEGPGTFMLLSDTVQPAGFGLPSSPAARFRLNSAARTQIVQYTGAGATPELNGQGNLGLSGTLLLDPRLRVATDGGRIDFEAIDDKGASVGAEQPGTLFPSSSNTCDVQIPLQDKPGLGRKLANLRGKFVLFAATKRVLWEVPGALTKAKGATKTVKGPNGDETYTIKDVVKTQNGFQVKIAVTRPAPKTPPPAADAAQDAPPVQTAAEELAQVQRDLWNWASLLDTKGHAFGRVGGELFDNGEIGLNYHSEVLPDGVPLGAPDTFLLEIPLEVRLLEIPFDFKDIPLP